MARYSLAQIAERVLLVRAGLRAGQRVSEACKAAGVSTGTYKRWLEVYANLDLPSFVLPAVPRGGLALGADGRALYRVDDGPEGYTLARVDLHTGVETARATVGDLREDPWREVVTVVVNREGTRLLFAVSNGRLYAWDLVGNVVLPCEPNLHDLGIASRGRVGSGARRWAFVAISPDLSCVAYWPKVEGFEAESALCVVRLADGAEVMRYAMTVSSIPSELVFHPTRPLLGFLGWNNLIVLLDLDARSVRVEGGPQAHAVSFGPGDTLLYDDWYGQTQAFDYVTGTSRLLAKGWCSKASMSDRYVADVSGGVGVRSLHDPNDLRCIGTDGEYERFLSKDGARLVLWADPICVWDLDRRERPCDPP